MSVGGYNSCAVRGYDKIIVCWGDNSAGQSNAHGAYGFVGTGFWHLCALEKEIGCWGYNGDGQTNSPTGMFGALGVGAWHNCASSIDGRPTCWGWNYYNQATTAPPAATTYVPVAPTRLLDSRNGTGGVGRFSANSAQRFKVAGVGPVSADAVAVTGNFTVTRQTAGGYASLGPVKTNTPTTSTLNFPRGDTRANNVTVALDSGGYLSAVYKAGAGTKTDFIFDVTGYFLADDSGETYNPVSPVRLLDTRVSPVNGHHGAIVAKTPMTWTVAGRGEVPANATAVTGNLTVTGQGAAGYVYLGPVATSAPTASTLNFPLGDTRANGVTVQLGASGTLSAVYISGTSTTKTTHLILDVTGYYLHDLSGAHYFPLTPDRVLDSRTNIEIGLIGPFHAKIAQTLTVAARVGAPSDAIAISGNLTVVGQTGAGYVSLTKATTDTPTTSTINVPRGDTRANGVTGPLSSSGTMGLVYVAGQAATTNLIMDITGYFK